jgi:hypothetical protein
VIVEMGMNSVAKALTAGIAAGAYTGLVLYHPRASGARSIRPTHVLVTPTVAPASVAFLAMAVGYNDSADPTLGSLLASLSSAKNKAATVGKLYDGMTIPTGSGNDRQTMYTLPLGFVGTTLPGLVLSIDQVLPQCPPLEPGGWALIASSVAMTIVGGLIWEVDG